MTIVFVISFAHQPVTLGLVYGDADQRGVHRSVYRWAPLMVIVVIVIGLNVSLALVGFAAGLWNAEHTLMQRYGVMRIYGRKAGDRHASLEKPMLVVWLLTALLFLGAYVDLPAMAARIGVDRTNADGVAALARVSGLAAGLFWAGALVSVMLAWRWIRAEWQAPASTAQHAKWIYAAGSLGLLIAVMVDPIAGVAGYVAAHAIEYFGIVHSSLRRRATTGDASRLALATATRSRRLGLYAIYFALTGLLIASTYRLWDGRVYAFAILFFGALHILYDGFIWKLRRPAVAASLGIADQQ